MLNYLTLFYKYGKRILVQVSAKEKENQIAKEHL